jgi:hypothetical protein
MRDRRRGKWFGLHTQSKPEGIGIMRTINPACGMQCLTGTASYDARRCSNVTLDESIEASHPALMPCSDERLCEILAGRVALTAMPPGCQMQIVTA